MALELRQQLKLTQQLVMTPQLQQAIKLLQLSRLELVETVQQELLENPFLEEGVDHAPNELEAPEPAPDTTGDTMSQAPSDQEIVETADWENYLGEFSSMGKQSQGRDSEIPEDGMTFEARLSASPSLEGHLGWQLHLSDFTPRQMEIGEAIIGSLNSSGYLHTDLEDIATLAHVEVEEVEPVLHRIQRFDPPGVAARSARECLLIQMELNNWTRDPVLVALVTDHLEDIEKKRFKPLAKKFKLTMEDIKEYLDLILELDPMPGASFGSGEPQYVSPDVFVYKYDDDYVIVLNDDGLPNLQLNNLYTDAVQAKSDSDKDYFQDKMRSAVWLMKSLYQRQRTLYKVMESIVKFQRGFFDEGVTSLKPLILKDIAEDIGMHESTVSRITTSKYVSTPYGIFELKFFFNSALGLDDGSQVGSESVKALIKKLINEENPKKPLSDEKIAEILKEKLQVNIARRTVAKYRTAMDIASSSKRRQVF